jgi:hypothetical protein
MGGGLEVVRGVGKNGGFWARTVECAELSGGCPVRSSKHRHPPGAVISRLNACRKRSVRSTR